VASLGELADAVTLCLRTLRTGSSTGSGSGGAAAAGGGGGPASGGLAVAVAPTLASAMALECCATAVEAATGGFGLDKQAADGQLPGGELLASRFCCLVVRGAAGNLV
jgi:hypothetical protein